MTIIRVKNLILETTRRCNLACHHCMRGKSQMIDTTETFIDAAISSVDIVGLVTLTGGEPLLVPDICTYALRRCRVAGTKNYFISTNGTISPSSRGVPELLNACREFPIDPKTPRSSIQVSQTEYHRQLSQSQLREWQAIQEVSILTPAERYFLRMGNAAENKIDRTIPHCLQPVIFEYAYLKKDDGSLAAVDIKMLHISATGQVFSDSLSYRMMDRVARLQPKTAQGAPIYLGQVKDLRETLNALAAELLVDLSA